MDFEDKYRPITPGELKTGMRVFIRLDEDTLVDGPIRGTIHGEQVPGSSVPYQLSVYIKQAGGEEFWFPLEMAYLEKERKK